MSGPDNVMDPQEVLRFKLEELRRRHRTLDETIAEMEATAQSRDSLDFKRLKKEKLSLRDQITRLSAQLTPDIIA